MIENIIIPAKELVKQENFDYDKHLKVYIENLKRTPGFRLVINRIINDTVFLIQIAFQKNKNEIQTSIHFENNRTVLAMNLSLLNLSDNRLDRYLYKRQEAVLNAIYETVHSIFSLKDYKLKFLSSSDVVIYFSISW